MAQPEALKGHKRTNPCRENLQWEFVFVFNGVPTRIQVERPNAIHFCHINCPAY